MKKQYKLVLIDTGYEVKSSNGNVDIYVFQDDSWVTVENDIDNIGHGGAVLSIVSREHKTENYAVFKAIEDSSNSNIERILLALDYIYNWIDCDYIQMSFGVRGYDQRLYDICKKMYEERHVILIAALDNCGAMSYPAAFKFVIGVSGNPYIRLKDEFVVNEGDVVDVFAKSGKQIVAANNTKGRIVEQGNSFAASYVSSYLIKCGRKYRNKYEALECLDCDFKSNNVVEKKSVMKSKAVTFPVNKEMYSLINYHPFLQVDLVDVYDVKYSSNVGRVLNDFGNTVSYTVKNIDNCEWEKFDTFIIGHVRELGYVLQKNIKKQLLQLCLEHKKNVYCFDRYEVDDFKEQFENAGLILECADSFESLSNEGRLYQIRTPILCVLGTSKKQGKFTLQMQIKKVLEEKEVNIGMLGTEPTAKLLGCEEVLPLGYDSCLSSYKADDIMQLFNYKMHLLDEKNKDLILVGGQSGFLPHVLFNVGHANLNQIPFLLGTMPDGVILSFCVDDEIDYIRKAIAAIEALTNAKVFLLALYAFKTEYDYVINSSKQKLSDEIITSTKDKIKKELGLNVIVSGDEKDQDVLFEEIIKYYCE